MRKLFVEKRPTLTLGDDLSAMPPSVRRCEIVYKAAFADSPCYIERSLS